MNALTTLADREADQIHITAIKVIQLKQHGIQSLVKVETCLLYTSRCV